ncbi:MAG: flavodoxin-dependent (E)-4-hydroxy-3-methylbut-2-enyl-diphosphate synthase [Hyphomonadaceae bacterium]|nr:flavodoxin-dependent (E)-4-hydroxy-3-methylbut-2-enyl-diphosphate synthase [Clostridia bacterium]
MIIRKQTKTVHIGNVAIGGDHIISVQSMTNTDTRDVAATVAQIKALQQAGCELVRFAIPDEQAALQVDKIKSQVDIPLVADIHFDYRLALMCIERGIDKIRINPGNIGDDQKVQQVVEAAAAKNIPIRIGVNAGSLEKELLQKYGSPTAQAMVDSALRHVSLLTRYDFHDIIISIKSSNVPMMIQAYQLLSCEVDYPLHLGVTEAGTVWAGTIKSAVGIGALLSQGIGDTIRVSLTGDPVEEIKAGRQILKSLGLIKAGVEMVSCPTCGRCRIGLIDIANAVEKRLANVHKPLKVAVMGCAVNGPGEAREADIGIAGGDGEGLLFKKGEIIRKVPEAELVDVLMAEIENM